MFRITGDMIEITRGNKAVIGLTIEDYTFKVGDVITFKVYKKNGYDQTPVLTNTTTVSTAAESIDITLSTTDTAIGSVINKPEDYWYEIELNDNMTVVGYDDNGAKIFRLYPKGVES